MTTLTRRSRSRAAQGSRLGVAALASGALLLAGCGVNIDVDIDATGGVVFDQTIAVSKAVLAQDQYGVDTLEEWTTFLNSGTPGVPTFPGECTPGETASAFTLDCTVNGDVTTLSSTLFSFVRNGQTLTVAAPGLSNPDLQSLLVEASGSISVSGTVTSVSEGAVQVDANTVEFSEANRTQGVMSAVFTLNSDPGVPVTGELSTAMPAFQTDGNRSWIMNVTTAVTNPVGDASVVTVYSCPAPDADLMACSILGTGSPNVPLAVQLNPGTHHLVSVLAPANWWSYDVTRFSKTVQVESFRARVQPKVVGTPVPGRVLRVALGRWTPEPTSVRYRWAREMTTIDGTTTLVRLPRATGQGYKVTPGDVGSTLKVRVTVRTPGLPTQSMWLTGPQVVAARP